MQPTELTERQEREREYYNTYSEIVPPEEVDLEPVLGRIKRPWNSYWYVAELAVKHFNSKDQRLLDFGCGYGYYAMQYATIGYDVYGFDISPNNIKHAKHLAQKYQFEKRIEFAIGTAESLDYPDGFFDIIIGIDILHHVEIERAIGECARVLKRGGIAIFHEPVRVPIFDAIRESRLGTWLVPNDASFEQNITEDERKLNNQELEIIRRFDRGLAVKHFLLFSRFERFIRSKEVMLEKLDYQVLRVMPFFQRFAGRIVLTLHK